MKVKRIKTREVLFGVCRTLERHDLPGAWRLKKWLQSNDFAARAAGAIQCSTNHGFSIVVDPSTDNGVEKAIVNEGTYEEGTLYVMSKILKPGDQFLDIGANVGLMSLFAAKQVGAAGRVDSFEPLPEIGDLLAASVEINGFAQIRIHRLALGSKPAQRQIFRHPEVNRGSASLAWTAAPDQASAISIDTLDAWSSRENVPPPQMIKIDVEGWELEALKGARQFFATNRTPVVCIEFSEDHPLEGGTLRDLYLEMISHGYIGYVLSGTKSSPSPLRMIDESLLPRHDNVFFFPGHLGPTSFGLSTC